MDNLTNIRNQIDKLDKELVSLLIQRINLALDAYKYKQKDTVAIQGSDRVKVVLDKVRALARDNGGNEEIITRIYEVIIKELTCLQLDLLQQEQAKQSTDI